MGINVNTMRINSKIIPSLVAVLSILLLGAFSAQGAAKGSSIKFEEKSFDFGNVAKGNKPVSHEFEFVNDGEQNLVILSATAECGCTKPEYPQAPIPPGKRGRIKVTFNPAGFRGVFSKQVTVRTNGNPKKVRLIIKGNVQ